ncbi:hypothetical protein GALMADRAFT_911140 [Galerina marginata CBS 339.88]|uniref:Uncharacterized protein n=1 Tax=Galerina marginata (strain CBS 339.88) TaxID=685588 RepID=A0A067SSQ6_GALM3|nr:hypothetical protein GALMADRAFT_911140 [Galerina marginata CBS 339.88]
MAKGKEKKTSKRKHLVIVDPWTTNDEAISAWFTVMMKEHYPYAQVNSIYYRSSTNNKIVELSKDVDDLSDRISYVYEWKREGQERDPGERQWLQMFPKNGPIPPHYPIKDPYPPQVIIGLPAAYNSQNAPKPRKGYYCTDQRHSIYLQYMRSSGFKLADTSKHPVFFYLWPTIYTVCKFSETFRTTAGYISSEKKQGLRG